MVVEHPGILFILLLVRTINGKIKQKQKAIESINPGATIIPIIISSDKTQITLFRNKTAYPVYMTIGNLPKSIRRKPSRQGQILLAYLPTSRLLHISNKAARRRTQANLFHACMNFILSPLKVAGIQGIEIMSGDGVVRRGHPILAVYVGDYPEQCLATGAFSGDCPECDCPNKMLRECDGLWSRVVTGAGTGWQITTPKKPAPVARVWRVCRVTCLPSST